jgi:uncharacterized protein (TIGR02646 family)
MPHFTRTRPVPSITGSHYREFRPHVRRDFNQQCAYCLFEELLLGGMDNCELDHFRPKSRFPSLVIDFYNLYYSCHPCNKIKLDKWPDEALEAKGITLVDLCRDEFQTHFGVDAEGNWEGTTPSGRYTIDALKLNRRHLVKLRRLLAEAGLHPHTECLDETRLKRVLKNF